MSSNDKSFAIVSLSSVVAATTQLGLSVVPQSGYLKVFGSTGKVMYFPWVDVSDEQGRIIQKQNLRLDVHLAKYNDEDLELLQEGIRFPAKTTSPYIRAHCTSMEMLGEAMKCLNTGSPWIGQEKASKVVATTDAVKTFSL